MKEIVRAGAAGWDRGASFTSVLAACFPRSLAAMVIVSALACGLARIGAAQSFTVGVKVDLTVGNYPSSVAIGDLNGDGLPDLVVANTASNTVSILLGNGAGRFATKTRWPFVGLRS